MARLALFAFTGAMVAATAFAAPARALTNEEIALLSGANRQATLEEGAKTEGTLAWYCTLRSDVGCRPVAESFMKKYPFLKVSTIVSQSEEILQRSLAEGRARNVTVDVMQASVASALEGTNLSVRFATPEAAGLDPVLVDKDQMWVAVWSAWNGITWNTNRVPTAEAPKTWEALIDPKYKDKMFWQSGSAQGAPRLITHFRMMWGEDKALDFIKKLVPQNVRTAPGDAGAAVTAVVSGEVPIMIGQPVHQISIDKHKGAPVDGINPDPALARSSFLAVMRGAPHPHAAMLFVDFMLSKEGQTVLAANYSPVRPGIEQPEANKWYDPQLAGRKQLLLSGDQEKSWNVKSLEIYQQYFR